MQIIDRYTINLLFMPKTIISPKKMEIPKQGQYKRYRLMGVPENYKFIIDFDRQGKIEDKIKLQLRYRQSPIVRLEINARPHINPDGTIISGNHMHILDITNKLNWAYELDKVFYCDIINISVAERFVCFCKYCNISLYNINLQGVF